MHANNVEVPYVKHNTIAAQRRPICSIVDTSRHRHHCFHFRWLDDFPDTVLRHVPKLDF